MIPKFLTNPNPELFLSDNYVVLDFETTNLDKGDSNAEHNRIVCLCGEVRTQGQSMVLEYFDGLAGRRGNARNLERILEQVERADFVVAHNAKFEAGWLRRTGFPIAETQFFCTQLAEYTLRSNRGGRLSLSEIAKRRGLGSKTTIVNLLMKMGVCPSDIPREWLLKYCHQDVALTHQIFLQQREELFKAGLEKVFYTRTIQVPVLVDLESKGLCLDAERVEKVYAKQIRKYEQVQASLNQFTGGINTASPKQLAEFLYDELGFTELRDKRNNPIRTETGKRATGAEVISQLTPRNKRQREFLRLQAQFAELNAQVTKYLKKFIDCVRNEDLIFASINQTVTKTGRYSSNGKNYKLQFQNFDRVFKPLFRCRTAGWFLGEADESQLEFRVAVFMGNDTRGRRDIEEHVDVHSNTAEVLTRAGQRTSRQDAKEHTFKPLYGGTSGTKAEQAYYAAFRERYAELAYAQDSWVDEALLNGKRTIKETGNVFYYPDVQMTSSGYVEGNTKVRNYPIQYLATGEIVPIALVFAWYRMREEDMQSFIVNTIHDSIIAEVHPDEVNLYKDIMHRSLERDPVEYMENLYNFTFDVPLEAEVSLGTHWKSSKEWEDKWLN